MRLQIYPNNGAPLDWRLRGEWGIKGLYKDYYGDPLPHSTASTSALIDLVFLYNVALTLVKRPCLMCFGRRLFRIWPLLGRSCLMCFVFGALKIRDRIQTIPFKIICKASRGPQYRGVLIQDVYFLCFAWPYC